ncbi:hypothetical protein D9611_009131 [Ephemerocybe angulata]|uniref:Uncharacterized protein n=1 Tax=Ephemerocybe angulata TaxID=980116 RepID=A0A8H5FK39_9AGAR|nr:hypothetical protein D9611_009131 [Tulosesus angulatus]
MGDHHYYKRNYNNNNNDNDLLDITVAIRYRGLKATQYFSKLDKDSIEILRQDLIALKIPHPKAESIYLTSHGCVEFFWTGIEPHKILHKNLLQKLRPTDSIAQQNLQNLLNDLSMYSPPPLRPFPNSNLKSSRPAPPPHFAKCASASSMSPHRFTAFVPSDEYTKKRPFPQNTHTQPPFKKFQSSTARSTPPVEIAEVEKFLGSITAFQPPPPHPPPPEPRLGRPVVKNEPVEATMPPPPPPSGSGGGGGGGPGTAVQSLLRELHDTQKHVNVAQGRRDRCIEAIKRLEPDTPIPLMPAEKELADLKADLAWTKQELAIARKLSEETTRTLEDIRKEAKEPFIVPALLDAFLTISSLAQRTTR